MDFEIVWLIVLAVNLAVWVAVGRYDRLRYGLDRATWFPRHVLSRPSKQQSWVADKIKDALSRMLRRDDEDFSGFAPPRVTRSIISAILLAENVIALSANGSDDVWKRFSARSGQLACLNALPLVLLAFPSACLTLLVRQARPQVLWAHHLYSWIVWAELFAHALMESMTLPSGRFAVLMFGFCGLFLLASTACTAFGDWRAADRRIALLGNVPRHTIVGLGGLTLITMHSSSVPCRISGGAAILAVLAVTVRQANTRSVESNEIVATEQPESHFFVVELPHPGKRHLKLGEDCYYNIDGVPHRVMWLHRDVSPTSSQLILRKDRGVERRTMRADGPYPLPTPQYSSWKGVIGVIFADSGLFEAMHLARSRAELNNMTVIVWFTDSAELTIKITDLFAGFNTMRQFCEMYIVFSGGEDDYLAEHVKSRGNVTLIPYKLLSKETLIENYILQYYKAPLLQDCSWVVLGEAFRGLGVRIELSRWRDRPQA